MLHKSSTGTDDVLIVDISPLRIPGAFHAIGNACRHKFEGASILPEDSPSSDGNDDKAVVQNTAVEPSCWKTKAIHQLPPFLITWAHLERSEAKALGREIANLFQTKEGKNAGSRKPFGLKAGKSRRHGGYGIG